MLFVTNVKSFRFFEANVDNSEIVFSFLQFLIAIFSNFLNTNVLCLFAFVTTIFFVYLAFDVLEIDWKLASIFASMFMCIFIERRAISSSKSSLNSSFDFDFNYNYNFDWFIFTWLDRLLNQ